MPTFVSLEFFSSPPAFCSFCMFVMEIWVAVRKSEVVIQGNDRGDIDVDVVVGDKRQSIGDIVDGAGGELSSGSCSKLFDFVVLFT